MQSHLQICYFYDIENVTVSSEEQMKQVKDMESGVFEFTSSSKDTKSKLNKTYNNDNKKSINNNNQQTPNYKKITKDITKLEVIQAISNDPMKNVSVKCRSSSNFSTFYQTLKHHLRKHTVFILDLKDASNTNLSEPSGLMLNSDTCNFIKKYHAFFSF